MNEEPMSNKSLFEEEEVHEKKKRLKRIKKKSRTPRKDDNKELVEKLLDNNLKGVKVNLLEYDC